MKSPYLLDPSKTPKHLDLLYRRDGETITLPCIYRIERDTLTICYPASESDSRPTAFSASKEEQQYLAVLKRAEVKGK